jgi:hypothetical protein
MDWLAGWHGGDAGIWILSLIVAGCSSGGRHAWDFDCGYGRSECGGSQCGVGMPVDVGRGHPNSALSPMGTGSREQAGQGRSQGGLGNFSWDFLPQLSCNHGWVPCHRRISGQ